MVGPRTTGARVSRAVAVGVLVAAVLPGCGPNERRGPVELTNAVTAGLDELEVEVPSCNGDPEVTELHEDADEVVIAVTATTYREGDDCLDSIRVRLAEPLGDRRLVDGTSGHEIAVDAVRSPGARGPGRRAVDGTAWASRRVHYRRVH